ncbi:MAG: glycosyltransferase family A protein [Flavobacteriaceae bacterium]|nr:glycosyltransferase family A protein [Flavobacteriaceae bacterium]
MPQKPFFSVIITVFNKDKYLKKNLDSVLGQSYKHFEVIVINDGSTDGSERILKAYNDPRIRYFKTENQGISAARNLGIAKASTDYIAFVDADDYWYPFCLDEQHRLIEKYPNQKVFSVAVETITNGIHYPKKYSFNTKNEEDYVVNYFKASMLSSVLNGSASIYHTSVFDRIGLYDPNYISGEDTELYVRVGLNYSVVFSPRICVSCYDTKKSLSKTSVKLEEKPNFAAFESLEKHHPDLKHFLDLNRFSLAIKAKENGDTEGFNSLVEKIALSNLNKRQRFILKLPGSGVKFLRKLKKTLEKIGLRLAVFKS